MNDKINRAQGVLLGQIAGDSLGSLVEFKTAETIQEKHPNGVQTLKDGGVWNTLAGQATDDSEMALLLARMLVANGNYSPEKALAEYRFWLDSQPFDCGVTIYNALKGTKNTDSQANGAMMRISPLGIFAANADSLTVAEWAMQDARLTHPNIICQQANALYVMAIACAVRTGCDKQTLYQRICHWADELSVETPLLEATHAAQDAYPFDFYNLQGWVLIAWQNALFQLLHAPDLKTGVINTIKQGGDTDTNACICGALLGAVYGVEAIPEQWRDAVLNCRPKMGAAHVHRPRPECFWGVDALELAEQLVRHQHGSNIQSRH